MDGMDSHILLELKKSDSTKFDLKVIEKFEDAPTDFSKIRCPVCTWQPRPFDRWICTDVDAPEFFLPVAVVLGTRLSLKDVVRNARISGGTQAVFGAGKCHCTRIGMSRISAACN
jgi:hypothetical protein